MKIKAVRLRNVRIFGDKGVAIEGIPGGLSLLAAANEFGKSTIFDALRTVLFERHVAKNRGVRSLISVAGAAPCIELDFSFDEKDYRLRKQFMKRQFARLIDLETGHEIFVGDEAHEWITEKIGAKKAGEGPTGLLWVEQGKSMAPPDAGESGKELLASLLEHEVSDVTGGERARRLLARTQAELNEMVTKTGKPKVRTDYKNALETLEETSYELIFVQDRLKESETLLNEINQLDQSIKTLEDPAQLEEIETKLSKAQAELSEAKTSNKILENYRNSLLDKSATTKRAKTDLDNFDKHQSEVEQLDEKISDLEQKSKTLKARIAAYESEISELKDKEKSAKENRITAEKIAERSVMAELIKTIREQQAQVKSQLEKAEAASEETNRQRARLSANSATTEAVQAVRTASNDFEIARTKLEAKRPRLIPDLTEQGRAKVKLNGSPLTEEIYLSGRQVLFLSELGEIILESDDPEDVRDLFQTAEVELATALTKMGVDGLKAAESAQLERTAIERELLTSEAKLNQLAPQGLRALKEESQSLDEKLAQANYDGTIEENLPDAQEAQADLNAARQQFEDISEQRSQKEEQLSQIERELGGFAAELKGYEGRREAIVDRLGPEGQWQQQLTELQEEHTKAQQDEQELLDSIVKMEQDTPSLESAELATQRLEKAKGDFTKNLTKKREKRSELQGALRQLASEGLGEACSELEEELDTWERRVKGFEHRVAVFTLLKEELETAQKALQEKFLKPVSDELGPLLRVVLPGADVSLGGDYTAEVVRRSGRSEDIATLSSGTQEQIAVLTRLAFAQLMAKKGREMPVILDDALSWCDDYRLQKVFDALHMVAKDIQCIVLTCHERSFTSLGAPILETQDWPEASYR